MRLKKSSLIAEYINIASLNADSASVSNPHWIIVQEINEKTTDANQIRQESNRLILYLLKFLEKKPTKPLKPTN